MSTGAHKDKQSAESTQASGGNLVGKAPSAPIHKPASLGGKSFTADNQTTSRGKGRT